MSDGDGDDALQPVKDRAWIAEKLEDASVVDWDRFVVEDHDGTQCVEVYGWIDREDEYKDFVLASFWPSNRSIGFTTSSDEWSEYLHHEWIGGEPDGHNPCRRVEDAFPHVDNAIELTEQDTLVTDGGQDAVAVERDCEHSEVSDPDRYEDAIEGDQIVDWDAHDDAVHHCDGDAVGLFDIFVNPGDSEPIMRSWLCEEHERWHRDHDGFDRVREVPADER